MSGGNFKLGLFVTMAVALLVAFLLALGVLDRFKPRIEAETYFLESIQNLEHGAQVRFRGVNVGTVDWAGFVATEYPEVSQEARRDAEHGYIMVKLVLYRETVTSAGIEDVDAAMKAYVQAGLRARLATSGLGGPTFIELDYADPAEFPAPSIKWTPKSLYIPSAPSTIVSIIDGLSVILRKVNDLSVIEELAAAGKDLQSVLEQLEGSDLIATSDKALEELRAASAEARSFLGDPRLDEIIDDADATLKGARTLLESDRGEIETLIQDMTHMAGALDRAGTSLDTLATNVNESNLLDQMETLANDLGPAGRDLSDLAKRLDRLIKGNEDQIADAVRSLRDAALELQAMLEELKANPSRILEDPPPRGTPRGGS